MGLFFNAKLTVFQIILQLFNRPDTTFLISSTTIHKLPKLTILPLQSRTLHCVTNVNSSCYYFSVASDSRLTTKRPSLTAPRVTGVAGSGVQTHANLSYDKWSQKENGLRVVVYHLCVGIIRYGLTTRPSLRIHGVRKTYNIPKLTDS